MPSFVQHPLRFLVTHWSKAPQQELSQGAKNQIITKSRNSASSEISLVNIKTGVFLFSILFCSFIILLQTSKIAEIPLADKEGNIVITHCFSVDLYLVRFNIPIYNRFSGLLLRAGYFVSLNGLFYSFFTVIRAIGTATGLM